MEKAKRWRNSILFHFTCIALSVVFLYPVLWMVSSSLKDNSEVFANAGSLIPRTWQFANYVDGWRGFAGIPFSVFFKNTAIVVVLSTAGSLISSACIAYAFSRIRFVGRNFWFVTMMVTMMLPAQVLLIPQYILFTRFHWVNTFRPLIVPAFFGTPFFVFLIMQFIRGIPMELDESAKIDGCTRYSIFLRIVLPLIKPALTTTGIFSFYWGWQDFMGPLVYLNTPRIYTLSLALKLFSDPSSVTNWGSMFAMATLSLLPVLVVFLILQKYIVEGISTTGIKG